MTQDRDELQAIERLVESIRTNFGALFAIAIRLRPWLEVKAGVLPDDMDKGLLRSLFGGQAEVARLASGLKGRDPSLLPELWSQGDVSCVVDTNGNGWYAGFLFQTKGDVLQDAKRSKLVSAEFRVAFSAMS